MKKQKDKTKLGGLFYPATDNFGNPIPFDTLYIPHIYKEIYFEKVYDFLNHKKDLVIVDVGANIGIVTQYMRVYAKKIYSVEPSPEHFTALAKNKEFNNWDNVELFNYALADKDGEMEFVMNENNRTSSGLVLDRTRERLERNGWNKRIIVKTKTFASFMKENNINQIDFCKLDVEGADDLILRSEGFASIVSKIKTIEVEFHFPNWQELVKYMIGLGFTARKFDSSAIIVLFTR